MMLKGILKKRTKAGEVSATSRISKEKKTRKLSSKNSFTKVDDSTLPDNEQLTNFHNGKKHTFSDKKRKPAKKVFTKREIRQARLASKKHSDIVPSLLKSWEVLRSSDTGDEKKLQLVEEMIALAKGKIVDLCLARDTSRIIESLIQFGTEVHRWTIFGELMNDLIHLSTCRFAKFVIIKMITYGPKEHRLELFKKFRGHVAKLLCHKYAADVIELLYNDFATASQRAGFMQEIYGHEFALQLTANHVHSLEQAIALNEDKKAMILSNLNQFLVTCVSKGLLRLSIVQHVLLEYLSVLLKSSELLPVPAKATEPVLVPSVGVSTEKDGQRQDSLNTLIELILENQIVSMLHTREGVRAALAILWISPPKERKVLVKSLKTFVVSLACNEHGYLFLIGVLDAVDDAKLLAKTVVKELLEDLVDIVSHPHARKVLLYMLAPRDKRHFPPAFMASILEPGDSSPFTKKPLGLRAIEFRLLSTGLLPSLLRLANEKLVKLFVGNSATYPAPLEDRSRLILLAEVFSRSSRHELELKTALAQFRRSGDLETSRATHVVSPLSSKDIEELSALRLAALRNLVLLLLVPEFHPMGMTSCKKPANLPPNATEAKRAVQLERRKRALAIAESESVKRRKVTVKAFTNTNEMEDSGDGSDEFQDQVASPLIDVPFLERFEGQLFLKRLLLEEKLTKSYDLSRMIIELVPEENLRAWTSCNRSSFILVNLYELGDEETCRRIREVLAGSLSQLKSSTIPGTLILYKHLSS